MNYHYLIFDLILAFSMEMEYLKEDCIHRETYTAFINEEFVVPNYKTVIYLDYL